eukprot:10042141-Alexandrium_andersonii.AAC.1
MPRDCFGAGPPCTRTLSPVAAFAPGCPFRGRVAAFAPCPCHWSALRPRPTQVAFRQRSHTLP